MAFTKPVSMQENNGLYLELIVTRCRRWMGNRKFIWSGLSLALLCKIKPRLSISVMSETKALVEGNEIQQTDLSAIKERRNPLTTSRMVNLLLTLLFGVSIVFHIVCLVVMVAKHNELVDKWDPDDVDDDNDEWCILFMDYDDSQAQPTLKFKNNKCHVVIYGSGALAGCAFLMIIFLLFKTAIFRR